MDKLPGELKSLIRDVSRVYGDAIREQYGVKTYHFIESVRKQMKDSRGQDPDELEKHLRSTYRKFSRMNLSGLRETAHILGIYLELINRCEAAYRHHRIQMKETRPLERSPYAVIFVFTAHPTEARDPRAINLLKLIDGTLVEWLLSPQKRREENKLRHLLKLLMKTQFSKKEAPKVEDEIAHITSIVLEEDLICEQLRLHQQGIVVQFRTWVGGDKDGHPFVSWKQMVSCLQTSRHYLSTYAVREVSRSCELLANASGADARVGKLVLDHKKLLQKIELLQKLGDGDGKKIVQLRKAVDKLVEDYTRQWGEINHHLNNLRSLVWLYPALVLPLELREDSEVVVNETAESVKINAMLGMIQKISKGFDPKWYIRGFIMSMVQSSADLEAGCRLVKKHFRGLKLPVVPLFETRSALVNSIPILEEFFRNNPEVIKAHKTLWGSRFELMLGYSDSAKENGTLASRYLILETLRKLDIWFQKHKLQPVFFHGNGGSIERGGGSIRDQVAWMPRSALEIFKSTVQGEMVFRNFGDEVIMRSMVEKIITEFSARSKPCRENFPPSFKRFVELASQGYQDLVTGEEFPAFVEASTPYRFLSELKIGSRPSSRGKKGEFKLRAIPWILCWTQTRVLLPSWWGVGSAWEQMNSDEKLEMIEYYDNSPFLQSFMKVLGFTLAKVELGVFRYYLKQGLPPKEAAFYDEMFVGELEKTVEFFKKLTRQKDFLWFRPWLAESVRLRSPMIHPLNLIQLLAVEKKDMQLLRETVSGIASGMMTTG